MELVNLGHGFAILAWAAEMKLLTRGERIAAWRALTEERREPWARPSRLTFRQQGKIAARRGREWRTIAQAMEIPRSTVGRVLSPRAAAAARVGRRVGVSVQGAAFWDDSPREATL